MWAGRSQSPTSSLPPISELEDYMSDRVQFVITAQEWDPNFEEVSPGGAEVENPNELRHSLCPLITFPSGPLSPRP